MKAKLFTPLLILMLFVTSVAFAQDKKGNDKETVTFEVSMHCQSCQKRIEKNIPYEKGVTDLKVDLPNKTVSIEYKSDKTTVANLQKAIEKLGYTVTEQAKTEVQAQN